MRNTIKWFGIIALAAMIGFSFISCGDATDDANTLPAAKGKLTITGIPSSLNGNYAMVTGVVGSGQVLMGVERISGSDTDPSLHLVKITNGTVAIPLYTVQAGTSGFTAYTGNDTVISLQIGVIVESSYKLSTAESITPKGVMSATNVTFSGGSKELTWDGTSI